FRASLYICGPHAHTDSCPPKSPCAVEAMIVFGPSLPEKPYHFSSKLLFWQGTAAFWLAAVSAQNPHQKKIICGRRNIRTSFCPLVIVEGHSRWTPCSGRAHRLRNRSPRFIRAR